MTQETTNKSNKDNLHELSLKYEYSDEVEEYLKQQNSDLIENFINAYPVISRSFKNKPEILIQRDPGNGEVLIYIEIESNIPDLEERFNSKLKLLRDLIPYTKNYESYFGVTLI